MTTKIIIVDDHSFFRDGVKNFLLSEGGFQLIGEFGETRSILNANLALNPDVILLDINIPGIEGRQSCVYLKKRFPSCKIIALTQYANLENSLKKFQFDGYVLKDDTSGLLEAINTVLAGLPYFASQKRIKAVSQFPEDIDPHPKAGKIPRSWVVMHYVVKGLSSREISEKLYLSLTTVETHRRNFYREHGKLKGEALRQFLERHDIPALIESNESA